MIIYEPKGKAREYSPLAMNIFNGCDHGCTYCYVPNVSQRKDANKIPLLRKTMLHDLEKELSKAVPSAQILLCFLCDPYPVHDVVPAITRQVLEILLKHRCKVAILSKGGSRVLRDLDLILKFPAGNIKYGTTLTFYNDNLRKNHEPMAASVSDRLETLEKIHTQGIKTFASIEPVMDPQESLNIIAASLPFVNQYKIGKLNHDKKIEDSICWPKFLERALGIIRPYNKQIYVKEDLRNICPGIELSAEEKDMNALNL